MSIDVMIRRLEAEQILIRYLPHDGRQARRTLLLGSKLCRDLDDSASAINFFNQRLAIAALFDRWVLGHSITVRLKGRQPGPHLALLEPPPAEIWEFRVTEPRSQLRIFMRFAAPDMLIALTAFNRDSLGKAETTQGKRSLRWLEAMYGCEAEWSRIFGRTAAFRGRDVGDYVTASAEECA